MLAAEPRGKEGHVPSPGVEVNGLNDRDEPIPIHDGGRNSLAVIVSDVDPLAAGHEAAARRNRKGSPREARSVAVTIHAEDREEKL